MFKRILPFCCLLFTFTSQAQVCELPNGDVEVWVDFSADLGLTEEPLPAGTIVAPEGFFSAIRFLGIVFSDVFGELAGEELTDVLPNILGIQRSTDASTGDFAMRLQADGLLPVADVVSFNACNGVQPTSFSLDLKHVGNVADTLTILGSFGEMTGLLGEDVEAEDFAAFFFVEIVADASTDYQTISIPVTDAENEIAADSFTLILLLTSNETSISMGDTSYFLIDNMQFNGATTSTKDLSLPNNIEVYPTVFNHTITITNENEFLDATIYSIDGRRQASMKIPAGQSNHDVSFITNSGSYLLKMIDPTTGRSQTKMLIKE